MFDQSPPAISEMYNVVLHHVYTHAVVAMRRKLWEDELSSFAQALHGCGCPIPHCFGFVDAAMFDNRCPFVRQEAMYNERKRKHKVKYQGVVLANFMNGDWHVPANVHANDPTMLDHSRLVPRLKMMARRQGQPLCLDGVLWFLLLARLCRAVSLDGCTFRQAEQGGCCGRVENLSTLESWSQEGSCYLHDFVVQ